MNNIQKRKYNIRLYPIYKAFSWDLLFYYAIAYVFLVNTKNFSAAQVMLTDSLYPLFKIIFNIPANIIVDKYGKKNSLVFGNLALSLCILILIFSLNIYMVILSYAVMAFGFSLKHLTDSNLLADSIASTKPKGKTLFAKLEEIGAINYYFLDGISSFLTGFCFVINGYLPMIICLAFTIIAASISTCFKGLDTKISSAKEKKKNSLFKEYYSYFTNLKEAFSHILKSKRLQALLLFILFFNGLIYSSYTLRETLLCELNISAQYFAIIISSLTVVSAFTSSLQGSIHSKFRNKALSFISSIYVPTFILIGIVAFLSINWWLKITIILLLFAVQYAMQSPYDTLISTYSKSFTTSKTRVKISSAVEFAISFSQFFIAFISSILLEHFSIQMNFILVGISFAIILFLVLSWMKPRFGLDPNEYSKEDILAIKK